MVLKAALTATIRADVSVTVMALVGGLEDRGTLAHAFEHGARLHASLSHERRSLRRSRSWKMLNSTPTATKTTVGNQAAVRPPGEQCVGRRHEEPQHDQRRQGGGARPARNPPIHELMNTAG